MRAALIERPHKAIIADLPDPRPAQNEVRVRVAVAGVCATDLHILRGEFFARFPIVPGHEVAGIVEETGPGVAGIHVGDRVVIDPNIPCERCYYCRTSRRNHCESLEAIGVTLNGGFAEFVIAPHRNVYPIGDLDFPSAALCEPLACVLHGVKRAHPRPGEWAAVFGCGPMGLLWIQILRLCGAGSVAAVDISPARLEKATAWADRCVVANSDVILHLRDIAPRGFDIVVDATGVSKAQEHMVDVVAPDGRMIIFGVAPRGERITVSPYFLYRRDLALIGSFSLSDTLLPALELIRSGKVQVRSLVSHVLSLDEFPRALEMVGQPDVMKVQVHFGEIE